MKILLLAGGRGTRLWPLSRVEYPKQFLKLSKDKSLFQSTLERMLGIAKQEDIFILTSSDLVDTVHQELREIAFPYRENVLVEPEQKNTMPAILLALKYLKECKAVSDDEAIMVCPCDHHIEPQEKWHEAIVKALKLLDDSNLLLFGCEPHYPATGYGYLKKGSKIKGQEAFYLESFKEKPSLDLAQRFIQDGSYLWNSGVFAFKLEKMMQAISEHVTEVKPYLNETYKEFCKNFSKLPSISIDYAVMEKIQGAVLYPLSISWSDIGTWDRLHEILPKDDNGNVKRGEVLDIDTKNSLIMTEKRLVSTIGLEDMLIVETADVIFISKLEHSQRVQEVVANLQKSNKRQVTSHLTTYRPWGYYTILEEGPRYKVKKIVVNPGQSLSLQMHYHRSEHWVVVAGVAKVVIGQKEELVHENESIFVPKGSLHRVSNPGKVLLEIIEAQVGEYLQEDDILRFEDIYSRME